MSEKTTAPDHPKMTIPAIGDMLVPRHGTPGESDPGVVVAVLPSGTECVLARRKPGSSQVTETVHHTVDLKGPMTGRRVQNVGR